MKLTNEQINGVINWMNQWEQLKGTAISIRFKEDFTEQLHQHNVSGSFCNCGTPPNELDVNGRCETCGNKLDPMQNDR